MTDLIDLINFAKEYYYTKTEEYSNLAHQLLRIDYDNGKLELYKSIITNVVVQTVRISFNDTDVSSYASEIVLNFNYLPLEQNVEIKVNNSVYTNYTRVEDSIILNGLQELVTSLTIRVDKYEDDENILYKGLEVIKNYKPIFSTYDNNKVSLKYRNLWGNQNWILSDKINLKSFYAFLECSDNVYLSTDGTGQVPNILVVNFPSEIEEDLINMSFSFTISREDNDMGDSYHSVKFSKLPGATSFNIKTL